MKNLPIGPFSQIRSQFCMIFVNLRPYYTMHCFTLVFNSRVYSRVYSRVFPCIHDTNMFVSKTRVKTREKCKKNARKFKTRAQREKMFLYYTMRWAKSRVSCVLVAFWSRFAHKHYQNSNPLYSVIWPLVYYFLLSSPEGSSAWGRHK